MRTQLRSRPGGLGRSVHTHSCALRGRCLSRPPPAPQREQHKGEKVHRGAGKRGGGRAANNGGDSSLRNRATGLVAVTAGGVVEVGILAHLRGCTLRQALPSTSQTQRLRSLR